MQLIPAIDIRNGACVRLLRGEFDDETVYTLDPIEPARRYAELGAPLLHVVDLDGARDGTTRNTPLVRAISKLAAVQTGGGLRSTHDVERLLDGGASRVVIGSVAVTDPALTRQLLQRFGAERIVVAIDVRRRDGDYRAATHGWTVDSTNTLTDVLHEYAADGLRHVLITGIDCDGTLEGPNLKLYGAVTAAFPGLQVQASGGIRNAADLSAPSETGVAAATSGKALLEGRIGAGEMKPYLPNG